MEFNIKVPVHVIYPEFKKPESDFVTSISVELEDLAHLKKPSHLFDLLYKQMAFDNLYIDKLNNKWFFSIWFDDLERATFILDSILKELRESWKAMNRLKDCSELALIFSLSSEDDYTPLLAFDIKTNTKYRF